MGKTFKIITKGDKIDTSVGYLKIIQQNDGGCIYVEEYEIAECGYPIKIDERLLTIKEIEREAKTFDGRNHSFVYQN